MMDFRLIAATERIASQNSSSTSLRNSRKHRKSAASQDNPRLKATTETGKMHPIFAIAKMKQEVHLGSSLKLTLEKRRILFPLPPKRVSLWLYENQP
jgi:hypothetical protein